MSTLDLSQLEPAPAKVKLPDGILYDMANPEAMGTLTLQRLISRYRRAQEIAGKDDAGEADVEELLGLMVDVACLLLPDAPREQVGKLTWLKIERLADHFFAESPGKSTEASRGTSAN